jgi:phage gp36-like protein
MPVTATPISPSSVSGQYAAQSDIESQFGVNNVRVWSQLDNSVTTADESRIQQALNFADARIISTFAGFGNYVSPLAPLGTDVMLVTRWAAVLAGAWLYQSRGLRDDPGAPGQKDHISLLLSDVVAQMMKYRATEKLNAARRWPVATAPVGY